MKLLFDQNISFRVIPQLADTLSDSKHVRELGLENKKDIEIWNFARKYSYTIVTFDADFSEFANIKGSPPKVIWLRTGNTSTKNIIAILKSKQEIIKNFIEGTEDSSLACLELA